MNLVRGWPLGQAGPTPLGWRPPQPLMPPRVNGWPMGVVPSSEAEALLESAVGWWDASRYRGGDRWLRNQGIAGELLDLRLGSSTVANSNDPTWLGPEQTGYVYLPGAAGSYLATPHVAGAHTGDVLDVRLDMAQENWTSAVTWAGKGASTAAPSAFAWVFGAAPSNRMIVTVSDGTASVQNLATVLASFVAGTRYRVRFTYTRDTGAGQYEMKFYWSSDFSETLSASTAWTTLATFTGASIGAALDYNAELALGTYRASTVGGAGRLYAACVLVNGSTTVDIDCDAITSGSATSFTATTGQTVTINRSTSGRKSVVQPARGRGGQARFLLGTDDYFEVQGNWQHQLLNFGQGDSFTVLAVVRQWGTPVINGRYVSKRFAATGGWLLATSGTSLASQTFLENAAGGSVTLTSGTFPAGKAVVLASVIDKVANAGRPYADNVAGTTVSNVTSLNTMGANQNPVRVGRDSVTGTNYQDFEFIAAAIFRRALTAAEIAAINIYYQNRTI